MGGGASKRPPKRAVDSLDNPDHIQRPLWECGVELEYLIRLYAEMQTGIFSENPYFTTGDMVQQFILPKVRSKGQRFVDTVPHWHVRRAEVYVIHAWRAPFQCLVESLRKHFDYDNKKDEAKGVVLWLDFFAVNQRPGPLHQRDLEQLEKTIEKTHLSLLCLDVHTIVLTRTWCLFEIWKTIKLRSEQSLQVVIWRELKDIFRDVYIEHSFTSDPEDKERLLDICSEETQKLHMIDKEVKAAIAYAMTADLAVVMECGSLEEKRLAQHCCAHVLLLKGDAEEAYQAHRTALMLAEERWGKDHEMVTQSLVHMAEMMMDLQRYPEATRLHERVLQNRVKELGARHLQVAKSMDDLAYGLMMQYEFNKAEEWYIKSLAIHEEQHDEWHTLVAVSLDHLSDLYMRQQRWTEMAPLALRSAAIWERHFGVDHLNVAGAVANEAMARTKLGEFREAKPLHERVVQIRQNALGPNSPEVAQALNNFAFLLMEMEQYEEAYSSFNMGLETRLRVQGPNSPDVATCYNNLAVLLRRMHRLDEAIDYVKRAARIIMNTLGGEHMLLANTYNNLASLLMENKQKEEAFKLDQRALQIKLTNLGSDHPETIESRVFVAEMLLNLNQPDKAVAMFEEALEAFKRTTGPQSLKVASTMSAMAPAYAALGQHERALKMNTSALLIAQAQLDSDSVEIIKYLLHVADRLHSIAGTDEIKLIEAEGFYNQALRESIQKHGVSHIKVAAPLRSLGRLKAKRKELEMARELFERALEILEDHNGKDNVALCALLNDLSKCQYDLGEKDQARATMTRFLNIHQTTYGKNDPRVAIARTTYADVLRKVGETDLAEEHYLKAVNIYETQFELPNAQLFSDWGQAYAGLAEVSRGKQKTSEALEFYKKAIGMYEKGKGEHSAVVAQTRAQMASLLSAEGKKHEADSEMWQAVIATDWKGEAAKDPDAMQAVSKLADMMDGAEGESSAAASGRHPLKSTTFKRAMQMSEEGKYSEELVGSLRQVSAHYKAEGRHQDAQAVQKRLVDLIKEKPNHDKEELQEAVNDQAASLRAMGKTDDAHFLLKTHQKEQGIESLEAELGAIVNDSPGQSQMQSQIPNDTSKPEIGTENPETENNSPAIGIDTDIPLTLGGESTGVSAPAGDNSDILAL